ncbi:AP2/ERF and B3 domain-containing transcription repressor TEM1 [Spatholobus suberectus]|nr:AP2/ERF and B3 domain-containing transcription repressor TEM1 [Spatholobus suberectus]
MQRFCGCDAVTNFKPLVEVGDDAESEFLNSHSKSEIINMLRKHPYDDELQQSMRDGRHHPAYKTNTFTTSSTCDTKAHEQLFEKMVMPSDVGKLNQLVIPKQHAKKH